MPVGAPLQTALFGSVSVSDCWAKSSQVKFGEIWVGPMDFQEQPFLCSHYTVFQPHSYKSVHQELGADIQASLQLPFLIV